MSGSSEQERLQTEIEQLRAEVGETVEALVHQVDVPARVRERAAELTEEARERAGEVLHRSREQLGQTPPQRWAILAGAGAALVALAVVVLRARG